jgi:hypothetical protein
MMREGLLAKVRPFRAFFLVFCVGSLASAVSGNADAQTGRSEPQPARRSSFLNLAGPFQPVQPSEQPGSPTNWTEVPGRPSTGCWPGRCDDGNPCTTDYCQRGRCFHLGRNYGSCDDGLYCTENDRCEQGVCVGSPRVCRGEADYCHAAYCDEQSASCVVDLRHYGCVDFCDTPSLQRTYDFGWRRGNLRVWGGGIAEATTVTGWRPWPTVSFRPC